MSTELAARERTFDLTTSPSERWNEEMLQLVSATVLRGSATRSEQFYCLAVAESLNLNPFIDEIYFIKVKARDGGGKVFKPYIGRNGLVAKATERGAYFQAAEVHENDDFSVETTTTGRTKIRHRYTQRDRGAIVGAYSFLYGPWAHPSFAYIDIAEYKPQFDEEWKRDASPWFNQEAAMTKKCAMIVCGRERLQLGNVLADGEIERVAQQADLSGPVTPAAIAPASEFDWSTLEVGDVLKAKLMAVTDGWMPAKIEMTLAGKSDDELRTFVDDALGRSAVPYVEDEQSPALPARKPGGAPVAVTGEVIDREPLSPEEIERVGALQHRIGQLSDQLAAANGPEEEEQLNEEIEMVGAELAAIGNKDLGNKDQGSLL